MTEGLHFHFRALEKEMATHSSVLAWRIPGKLSCSVACEIFPQQGSNQCLLHWQEDSSPLSHQGSPPSPPHYFVVLEQFK